MDETTSSPRRDAPAPAAALADMLLDGRLHRDAVPPAYAPVADLLDALRAPGRPAELAGEDAALAAYRRRTARSRRTRSLAAKVALTAVGVLAVGGVAAAATGSLPVGPRPSIGSPAAAGGSPTAADVSSRVPPTTSTADRAGRLALCEARGARGGAAEAAPAAAALSRLAGGADRVAAYCGAAGPGPADRAVPGLCRAYGAGLGSVRGGRDGAAAFEALAATAGGVDRVEAYCADRRVAASGAGRPAQPGAPVATPSVPVQAGPSGRADPRRPTAPPSATPTARHGGQP
ncbi:MAG TPA: hypothetical protein VF109_07395 [Mycobacteriales bacterium]